MKTSAILIILLGFSSISQAMDPPVIEWERLYFNGNAGSFYEVLETTDGGYAACGYQDYPAEACLFRFDSDGDLLWSVSLETYDQIMNSLLQLPDKGFITVGWTRESSSATYSLAMIRTDSLGQIMWQQSYGTESAHEIAHDIISLPDGGFVVCGEKDAFDGMPQAWLLRTDSQGDTLWTREWGGEYADRAKRCLLIENGLTVLMHGAPDEPVGGPHLVRYDLDGNMLWQTNIAIMAGKFAQTMCEASDGGLLLLNDYLPVIVHTDYEGNSDWYVTPPSVGQAYGWSIDTTMDGGIIYGGGCDYDPPMDTLCGIISRHDVNGDELWRDYVYNSSCVEVYSIRQLSQGGYIAAGRACPDPSPNPYQAILIKYAPETGITEPQSVPIPLLEVSPNPASSVLSVNFSLPVAGTASLQVYDLAGRLVDTLAEEIFPEGVNTFQWAFPENLSAGCYIVRLETETEQVSGNCVLIR